MSGFIPVGAIYSPEVAERWDRVGAWFRCDGSEVPRTYAELFRVLGDGAIFGAGDGATTFNVPDFNEQFYIFAGAVAVSEVSGDPRPRKPISGRSLSQQHTALVREGIDPEFRMRWLLRVTEGWLSSESEVASEGVSASEATE